MLIHDGGDEGARRVTPESQLPIQLGAIREGLATCNINQTINADSINFGLVET